MKKIKVGLLLGGNSYEREISFMTADEMMRNLDKEKYDVVKIEIPHNQSTNWIKWIIDGGFDIVISALHGGNGENGAMQGLLECLHIPYVGSKVLGSAISMDKHISKTVMKAHHVPVCDDVFISKNEDVYRFEEEINMLGYPVILKPNLGGSSIGIAVARDFSDVIKGVLAIKKLNDDVLIEKFIKGREVTCGLIEDETGLFVLTLLDIHTSKPFFDYDDKYAKDDLVDFSTLPPFLQTMIKEIAKKVFGILKCAGYAVIDMIIAEEQIYVLEVNTLPGMTARSLIPQSASGAGIPFSKFLDTLIDFELRRI